VSYRFEFGVVAENADKLANGALLTLELCSFSMLTALIVALITLYARTSKHAALRWVAIAYIEIIRNTPFLLQLYFFFFALPSIGLRMSPNTAAILALTVNGGAYAAEIIRGGMAAVPKGQREAGYALGLKTLQVFRLIVLKPTLRAIYPALTSQFILLLLTSSIVAAISATELTSVAQMLDSITFRSFEIYFTVTAIYLAMSLAFSRMFNWLYPILFPYPVR
jgi:polar amino acid transport system permease protein